jgi:hypothetical protein
VTFSVFRYTVTVIYARDMVRTGKRLKEDLANAAGAFVTKDDQPYRGWVVLCEESDEGVISHEASHCVRHMLTNAGASLDDETFAYHLQFLVDRIHRFLKRTR